jgi:hypothetical protein
VVDVQDPPIRVGEDGGHGGVPAELVPGGEVGPGAEEFEYRSELRLLLGVLAQIVVERAADVLCRHSHNDHLSK